MGLTDLFSEEEEEEGIRWDDLTEEEEEKIVEELSKRMKDVIFMNSKEHARKAINMLKDNGTIEKDDHYSIDYTITILGNDLIQIIGRDRR